MTRRKRMKTDLKNELSRLCGQLHPEDGLDPRHYFRKHQRPTQAGRKALQLCSQVADTLNLVLAGESGDPVLHGLQVAEVTPAPDASQLLVIVAPAPGSDPQLAADVEAALVRAAGWLRTEIAAAITRKRTPQLVFRYVGHPPSSLSDQEVDHE